MSAQAATTLLALATAVHLGFQLTVTVLVYPALLAVPADGWPAAHLRHSRAVAPVVVGVYGALVAASAAVLLAGPEPLARLALAGVAATLVTTAALAAPLHGRLGATPHADAAALRRRLVVVDGARLASALVAATAAAAAAL